MAKTEDKTGQAATSGVRFSRAKSRFFLGLCRFARPILHGTCRQSAAFKEQKRSGAMLVLSNHLSAYDFIHFASAMNGAPLNFVVAENMMYSMPIFARLIGSYNAITKKQYYSDFQCIKSIKKNLDAGISVLMCPEGKVSADGVTGAILPSIARLVKWLGYPVGVIKMQGASLARPKWAYNLRFIRRGRVYADCDMLFTAEEVKALSNEEILQKIHTALEHNEHKWQLENEVVFKGRRYAEGLNRLLYRCPKCGSEFQMTTNGSHITCTHCGNDIKYCFDGRLEPIGNSVAPKRIDIWYAEQRAEVARLVASEDFCLSDEVSLLVENKQKNGYRFVARGVLRLDREGLSFDSSQTQRPRGISPKYGVNNMSFKYDESLGTEPVESELMHLELSTSRCDTVANLPGTAVDMYDDKHVYRFMFDRVMASTKYTLAIEEAYKLSGRE